MSYGISIRITDTATPVLKAVDRAVHPEAIRPIVGRSATNTIREHLFGLNQSRPNQLGGRRTQFYAQAARGTHFDVVGETVVVSINQVGIAQRYFGGTIRPKSSKFLTIPVHPAAHGKRAREMNLELVFGANGEPIALATRSTQHIVHRTSRRGKVRKYAGGRVGEIMFRLVRSVNQKADPTVLPYDELVYARIERDVTSHVNRAIERAKGGSS